MLRILKIYDHCKGVFMESSNSLTLTFKAQSFRKIPNPYLKKEEGDKNAEMYMAICDVKDLPDNFPMDTNPREQKLTTFVAKKIKDSLLGSELNFFLLKEVFCFLQKVFPLTTTPMR
jgi:hypothetical protein